MKHMAYIPGEKIWVKHECFFLWNHRQDVFTIEIVRWIFSNLKSEVDLRKRPVLVEAAEKKNKILYTRMLKGQNISGWFNLKSSPPRNAKHLTKKTHKKNNRNTFECFWKHHLHRGGKADFSSSFWPHEFRLCQLWFTVTRCTVVPAPSMDDTTGYPGISEAPSS